MSFKNRIIQFTSLVAAILLVSLIADSGYAKSKVKKPNSAVKLEAKATPEAAASSEKMFKEALISTYNLNPRLKSEREALTATDELVSQAFSGWLPSANADLERGRQRTKFGNGQFNYSKADTRQLQANQPIFNGGETIARIRSSKNLVRAGRAQLHSVEQETLLDAITAYMDVVQNQSVLELSNNNVGVLRKQLKASRDRFSVGEVTRTDVAQSEARLSRAQSEASQAQGQLIASRAIFRRVVGYESSRLEMPPKPPGIPASLLEATEVAIVNNPAVDITRYRQLSAKNDVWIRAADILPDVSLQGSFRRDNGAGVQGNQSFDEDVIAVNLRVPLYQSGAEYSRVREASRVSEQRRFEELSARDRVREDVTRAWERYQTSQATIISNDAAIKAAQIALDGVQQEEQYGARTTLDVLDAEQELFVARVNLVRSQREEMVALYTLLASMGRLTAKDLALETEIYNPKVHYDKVKYKIIGF